MGLISSEARDFLRWRATLPDVSHMDPGDAWMAFSLAHDDRCAFCRRLPDKRLVIDHDHYTGLVRGLLCHGCNVKMPSAAVWRMHTTHAYYVHFPPAAACGLRTLYTSRYVFDLAPELDMLIWEAGPDGLERHLDSDAHWAMKEAAVEKILTL